jgi:hypothetical protein
MKPSVRKILADSHVAAVAISVFLLRSLNSVFATVVVLDVPYFSRSLGYPDTLITMASYLFDALISFTAAWLLSRWVYGVGPFRSLTRYRSTLTRRNHV